MTQSEKRNNPDSVRNNSVKQPIVLEDDYDVRSRIANSRSITNMEGYPAVVRTIFDPVHLDPDESEYSSDDISEADNYNAVSDEGYALHPKRKPGYD